MGKYMELQLPYLAAIHPRTKPPMWQSKWNQQRPNHSSKGFLKSRQNGCSQFQKISWWLRRGKNNTKIFQVKIERLLSISEEIKTAQICLNNIVSLGTAQTYSRQCIGHSTGQRAWKRRGAYSPPPLVHTHVSFFVSRGCRCKWPLRSYSPTAPRHGDEGDLLTVLTILKVFFH